jgi:hypothetical protein
VAGACKCGSEPWGSIKCGEFLTRLGLVSFSGRTLLNGVMELLLIYCESDRKCAKSNRIGTYMCVAFGEEGSFVL